MILFNCILYIQYYDSISQIGMASQKAKTVMLFWPTCKEREKKTKSLAVKARIASIAVHSVLASVWGPGAAMAWWSIGSGHSITIAAVWESKQIEPKTCIDLCLLFFLVHRSVDLLHYRYAPGIGLVHLISALVLECFPSHMLGICV